MSSKIANFISTLIMHFPVRFDDKARETEWLGSVATAFRGYDGDVLKRAAQKIIDTRTDRRFPLIADIHKVCGQIIYDDKLQQKMIPGSTLSAEHAMPMSGERRRLADSLVMGEMGRQAADDGWVLALHDFIRAKGRMPQPHEVPKLKAEARGFDEALEQCRHGGLDQAKGLAALGVSMLARRQELTEMVLHGVVK